MNLTTETAETTATWLRHNKIHSRTFSTAHDAQCAMNAIPWALGLPTWERVVGAKTWIYQDCVDSECERPHRYLDENHIGAAHAHRIGFYMLETTATPTQFVTIRPREQFPAWAQ
ncbi:hypothetical protein [Nocardia tengchongensis]|uniref:hypothetical protein n=1 Tax=Nocardia tengchongensis TaxID=2055889 RepID=UPI0036587D2C